MIVGQSDKEFFIDVLKSIGAPVTKENLKFLAAWRQAEGGTASNNPFNTTYKLDSDSKKTDYNSVGVKNYSNRTYGLAATTKTLKLPYYKNIVKGLQNNIGASNIASNTSELKTWGTGEGVARVLNGGKIKPPTIGDGKNAKVYSGSAETDSEEVSPGELAAVEVEKSKKITPNWWEYEQEEEVIQQPAQQPQTYSNQLPYDLLSTIPAEDQALLFGQQMFDEGGIVKPAGDPWEYKKEGDKYLTRKRGSDSWITATGLPEESIKATVFKEIPVSDRVREASASYTREKTSQPKSETPRRKEAWRDVKGVERPKTYREARADGDLSQDELESINLWTNEYGYEMDWDAPLTSGNPFIETQEAYNLDPSKGGGAYIDPNTFMVVSRNTPGAVYKTKNQLEQMVESGKASYFDKAMSPIAYAKSLYDGEDMGVGQHWFSEDVLGYDRGDDSWGKIGVDFVEDLAPDLALGYVAPWTIPLTVFGTGLGMVANYGYNDEWKGKYGDMTGTQYIEKDIADEWTKTKRAYSDDQGKFKLPRIMKQDLGAAGDVIEDVGQGIQSGANWIGDQASDFVDWIGFKDGGPKVKQRRGSRKNYDNKTWTPSGLQFPTSESSHLMMAEYDDDIDPSTGKPVGWVGFPSLFQDDKPYANDQDNWVQMSGENGWGSIYEEAKKRGEVYYFGEDKESALAFGEGSWKDQLPDKTIEKELTDKEVEGYRLGGYTVEEIK